MQDIKKNFYKLYLVNFFIIILLSTHIMAKDIDNPDDKLNSQQEQIFFTITNKVRCLNCQGEIVRTSNSLFAVSIKNFVKQEIIEGKSQEEIISSLESRYGEEILTNPKANKMTYWLWYGPFLIVIVIIMTIINFIRRT